jgi:small subunit ribosomal protein S11
MIFIDKQQSGPSSSLRSIVASQGLSVPLNKIKFTKQKQYKPKGIIYIHSTQNNTIVTLTDLNGNTKSWASGGSCGFQGSRRSSTYAAKAAAQKVANDAVMLGLQYIRVQIKGLRRGKKKSAVKGLTQLHIVQLIDTTSIPHNGCRAPKERRT